MSNRLFLLVGPIVAGFALGAYAADAPPAAAAAPADPGFPQADLIDRSYPDRALRVEKQGEARLRCRIVEGGAVSDCVVVSETPEGFGFGASALNLSKNFRMRSKNQDGVSTVGSSVVIPVKFELPPTPTPIPTPTPTPAPPPAP